MSGQTLFITALVSQIALLIAVAARRIFNTGSPRNIVAGSQANLDELRAHYQRELEAATMRRAENLKKRTENLEILGDNSGKGQGSKGAFASFMETFGVVGKREKKNM